MSLYVAVMERLVKNLGLVLPSRSDALQSEWGEKKNEERKYDDFTASPLLFPSSNHIPHWNVDILRGGVFKFYDEDGTSTEDIAPVPIVEFSYTDNDSEALGHVLVRLQGRSLPNRAFTAGQSGRRVTLVFDACFR
ncbi:unnamed protein product [Cylindrotheca closterium]|nr:unnamed protein product [Cylindrotheca closterium]